MRVEFATGSSPRLQIVFVFGFSLSSVALHVGFMYAVRGDLVFWELA